MDGERISLEAISKQGMEESFATAPASTLVPVAQRNDIQCDSDKIQIFLPSNLISEDRNLTWRDEDCKFNFNGTHYISSAHLTECGMTVQIDDDTVSFSNELLVHKIDFTIESSTIDSIQYFLPDDSDITYGEEYETVIPIECIYPRHNNVTTMYMPIKQHVRFFEKRYGQLDLHMKQYRDDSFDQAIPESGYPCKVPLDNDVFIGVGMKFVSSKLRLKLERCIATATSSPADKNWRELVHSGCPVNGVHLLSNSSDQDVRFSFKAFDFRHNSSGFIYIHCESTVCERKDPSCQMGCPARTRRSAEGGKAGMHLVSTGPLLVDREETANKGQVTSLPSIVAAVSLLVAMVAVVMAIIGWTRRSSPRHVADI